MSDKNKDIIHRIIGYAEDSIVIDYPYLGILFTFLSFKENSEVKYIGIQEGSIVYNRDGLIRLFSENEKLVRNILLHSIIHFIFAHDEIYDSDDIRADKAVREIVAEMNEEYVEDDHSFWKRTGQENASERRQLSKKILSGMDIFGKGTKNNGLMMNLRKAVYERHDYKKALKKFLIYSEEIKVSDDEYDTILYTYGLSLDKDRPIVEMNEYSEAGKIKELVIALDSSGSTSGKLVQSFLDKTLSVLSEEEYFREYTVYILQCDNAVRKVNVVHNKEEMLSVVERLTIEGFGATDFRPVFDYIDELIKKGELTKLQGLIYFTDGQGIYPDGPPLYPYKTMFVYPESKDMNLNCPPWAIREVM